MAPKNVFMFAGQGSQYYGMGRELMSGHPVFARSMRSFDELFADAGIPGVRAEIYREDRTPADPFGRLRFTHPAILMTELAMVETLRSAGVEPDYVLGASLGEFAAATAAGAVGAEDLVRSIVGQIGLLEKHCPSGGMVAVLDDVAVYERDAELRSAFELAAVNSDRHFVLAAGPDDLARLEALLGSRGIVYQRLPVSFAFHSSRMDSVAGPCLGAFSRLTLGEPVVPYVSCVSADLVTRIESRHFWQVVRSPIRFRDAVRFLENTDDELRYIDLGPSATMAGFAAQNRRPRSGSQAISILDPFAPPGRALDRITSLVRRRGGPAAQRGEPMKAIVFPGQGSQTRGMGGGLFARFPELTAEADAMLGYSIEALCLEDPQRRLDDTRFTQPALYVVNALTFLAKTEEGWHGAGYFAGHSLGEYDALFAAGVFDFGTGLRLVCERARLMAETAGGGMAAVIGLDPDTARAVLRREPLNGLDLANHNAPGQLIVSGPRELVALASDAFTKAGARAYIPLRVSGAFHSRYMEPARREFERVLARQDFQPLKIPVISNVTGRPHDDQGLRTALAEQLVRPVQWERTIGYLLEQGVEIFEEAGPGNVLSGLISKIRAARPARTTAPAPSPASSSPGRPRPENLGSAEFRSCYGTRYAYVCGSMYRGIASEELVIRAARAGLLAFFGTGGLGPARIAAAIDRIGAELGRSMPYGTNPYGMNLVHDPGRPEAEDETVALFLRRGITNLEASTFMKITPALARYRLNGLGKGADGEVVIANRIIAKVSRPEVAESFLAPAPERLVSHLEQEGLVTAEQAALAARVPMADDICVEADSGGHTDRGDPLVLLPTMARLRDRFMAEYGYTTRVRVGAAGGIGTPEAAAAAFVLGADFVLTGSINLCTAESGMSASAKDMLEKINIQDTDYAPAGDMFELGAQVQVLKRGVFFPARARKLYELYRRHDSLDDIDAETRSLIEERYFHRTFDEVWRETKDYFSARDPRELAKAEENPKHRMALVFRWYFGHSQRLAMDGATDRRVDFQVHCGPALGAFNQWVKGTSLERWRARHVDEIAERLMSEAAAHLERCLAAEESA